MRPLSHSSISTYTECPQKYKFKYIDKLPEKPKYFFSFGKSVHSALEFFYNIPALPAPTLDQILEHYKQNWISEGYKDPAEEQKYYDDGEKILRDFYRKHIDGFQPPLFAEYKFDLKVEGVPVIGFVDRIDRIGDDHIAIVDYKTGKAFTQERVKTDAQLTMYQMACEELLGMPVESLTFYHLNSQTAHTVRPHSKVQVGDLRRRIVTVADSIQKKLFDPAPEERKCAWCDFKPLCPIFRDHYDPVADSRKSSKGAEAALPIIADAPLLAPRDTEDESIAALVDRYGKLMEEIQRMQAEADQLSSKISDGLRERGWVRAFGSAYEAAAAVDEKWEFSDKAKVLDVIRKSGHWDDILAPSAPLVQKLMNNPSLPPDLRKRLESLARKTRRDSLRLKRTE